MNALVAQTETQTAPAQPPARVYVEKELTDLVRMAEDAEEATNDARALAERCRDYYDGKQLTSAELAILRKRGQPDIIINRTQTKINYLLGYEATTRTDPKAFPRTPKDEEAAEACTDALNYVRDTSDQKMAFSQVWENLLIEGFGGVEIVPAVKADGDADFEIKRWHWDRLFYDPHSREHDFSDAKYLGGYVWMDLDDARAEYPGAEDAFSRTLSDEIGATYDDRPAWRNWVSGSSRKRIRIVQMYYLCPAQDGSEKVWHWCLFTKGGVIKKGQVPYRDQDNKSFCPMILQSAFVDRANNRYGFVKALLGPQDEINKRRSKLLHEVSVRQFVYADGEIDDVDATKAELARPDGAIKVNKVGDTPTFQLLDRSKEIAGHTMLQQEAKQEIDLMGPNAAMFGKGDKDASGRAILANQQGGQIEIAVLMDRQNHFKKRVHTAIWSLIRIYWTGEKWVRVTDEEDNVRFVGFNRPVMMAEDLLKQAVSEGVPEDEAKARLAEASQDPVTRAQLEQPVRVENVPADMGMDVILEEIPDTANIQQEQFEVVSQLAPAMVQAGLPPSVGMELVIKASALRNKKEVLQLLEKAQENPQAAQAAQIQMEKAALEFEKGRADIAKAQADTARTLAEIEKMKAQIVELLAKADTYDQSIGTVTDPAIKQGGGQETPVQSQQETAAA